MENRLVNFCLRAVGERRALLSLGGLLLAAVALSLLLPGHGLATEPVFQSGVTSPVEATPTPTPPPPTDTPPPPPPDTPPPPEATDTPPPPEATDTPAPTETPPPPATETPSAAVTVDEEPSPTSEAAAVVPEATPTPVPEAAPIAAVPDVPAEESGGNQPFVINRIELVDTIAVSFSYLVICCGAGILLLIPLGLLFLQIRGSRMLKR